jgi:phosphoribosyl-AMP cyclohydrolase
VNIDELTFGSDGLVVAVVQQHDTHEVLMVAYMNAEAVGRTLADGRVTYWSRSRNELWHKGDTSGNSQRLVSITADCDGDALLVVVDQTGPACHTGTAACFTSDHEVRA